MNAFFHTLGCKVNQYETQCMMHALTGAGFAMTHEPAQADVIVINSCTVTAESDRKARQLVRRYRRLNADAVVVLTGCMPQAFPAEADALPADIVLGNTSSRDIVSAVNTFLTTHTRVVNISAHARDEAYTQGEISGFSERTRAYMKIEDGCDRGCTYCIIPKARGRVRSRSLTDISAEAARLATAGFCELVLVGINLSSFGCDTGLTLDKAVATVAAVPGIERVRLGSLEPDLTDTALLHALRQIPEFCPQFHLSLQSGCDATLKRMNRLYTTKFYRVLVQNIRALWDNASITTDIMVGFVGETEAEFAQSLAFAEEMQFLQAHIFPYSVRSGTAAAQMPGHVDESEKAPRAARMATVCDAAARRAIEAECGKVCTFLPESREGDCLVGHSENYTKLYCRLKDDTLLHHSQRVRMQKPYKDGALAVLLHTPDSE